MSTILLEVLRRTTRAPNNTRFHHEIELKRHCSVHLVFDEKSLIISEFDVQDTGFSLQNVLYVFCLSCCKIGIRGNEISHSNAYTSTSLIDSNSTEWYISETNENC